MRFSRVATAAALLCFAATMPPGAAAAAQANKPVSIYEVLGVKPPGLRGAELDAAVREASAFPLGSEQNPVRTQGIAGQRSYLARLRCSNGRAPKVLGRGIGMPSPFGGITDFYSLRCERGEPAAATIAMDMYHEHVEHRPVPGFNIVGR
jgi:hypothetical protein